MPARREPVAIDRSLCIRCQAESPIITTRNEAFCQSCFCKYAATKIVKRMETFRVRHSEPGEERKLLLPLSFGPSSTSLLHVLSQHLKGQADKTGRTGFKLLVLHVDNDALVAETEKGLDMLEVVKLRYPEHAYSSLRLSDLFSYGLELSSLAPALELVYETSNADKLKVVLSSLNSETSRSDVMSVLQRRLIVAFAKAQGCEAIIWGHSTTALAERVLAETAKGRGFALPWIVADGESPHNMPFHYPMRDLLSKESEAFASVVDPPLDDMILQTTKASPVSMKNTTIDDLMSQYFESVEREYPSIVANVVKTTGKLQAPSLKFVEAHCELCDMPLNGIAPEKSRLCYGCIRTLPTSVE